MSRKSQFFYCTGTIITAFSFYILMLALEASDLQLFFVFNWFITFTVGLTELVVAAILAKHE